MEAEARDQNGAQKAAMVWARGANSFTSSPRMSSDGDAYDLASSFGDDFSKFVTSGASPYGKLPSLPSFQKIKTSLGGAPKNAACAIFGREPGIAGMIGNSIAMPPSWTDKGASVDATIPGSTITAPSNQADKNAE